MKKPERQKAVSLNEYSASGLGRRQHNEDYLVAGTAAHGKIFIVCDGVGGASNGAQASKFVGDYLLNAWKSSAQSWTIQEMNEKIIASEKALRLKFENQNIDQMATTVVMVQFHGLEAQIAWVGDSPLFHFDLNGQLQYRTKDHSMVQNLVDAGVISAIEAKHWPGRNIITRSISLKGERTEADTAVRLIAEGDVMLLASDGVLEGVDVSLLKAKVKKGRSMKEIGEWIEQSCEKFTKDNYTFFLIKL
ncbi:PP2C family protein-serine/threonine phosphatase [Persicobacter diffluens]|uniref:PPM-type phosphatase domain-containing protein n=1 Tax=Persicobacter diffluens TaxID=981 RepID=A0AAN4W364_9BACT|nr:hypothetical protein PEDI_44080 [Persicobacter diffluens]